MRVAWSTLINAIEFVRSIVLICKERFSKTKTP